MIVDKAAHRRELIDNWRVILAAFTGLTLGAGMIPFAMLGPLMPLLEAEFDWSRGGLLICASLVAGGMMIGTPIAGKAIDRIGPRMVATFSMTIQAGCFAVMTQVTSLWQFQLLYFLMSLFGAGSGIVTFTRAIGARIIVARGTAIGIGMVGGALTAVLCPLLAFHVGEAAGWRGVLWTLALLVVFLAMPIIWWGIEAWPKGHVEIPASPEKAEDPERSDSSIGYTRQQATRDIRFYGLAAALSLFSLFVGAVNVNMVPMLIDEGGSADHAARMASLVGIISMFGRFIVGWLLDRFNYGHVGCALFGIAAGGAIVFVLGGPAFILIAALSFGFTLGSEMDLLSYATLRSFGLRHYGDIYGLLFGIYCLFAIVGPVIGALILDAGGYQLLYLGAGCAYGLAALIFLMLAPIQSATTRKPAVAD